MNWNCEPSTMIAPTRPAIAPLANMVRTACQPSRTPPYAAKRGFLPRRRQSNGDLRTRSATSSFASNDLRRKGAPLRQCGRASLLVDLPGDKVPLLIEMIVDLSVN